MCGVCSPHATSPCNPCRRAASFAQVSGPTNIEIGDRVVHLQVPGVFVVVGRRGSFLHVESPRGLRMTVHESGVRRVEGAPPEPKDA